MGIGHPPQSKTRSASEMFPLIQEWEGSGLSQKAFCNHQGIKPHVFWYWLRRYREQQGALVDQERPGFVSVEMDQVPAESVLAEVIYPDGTRLILKEGVSLSFLQSLLHKP